jgi:hypothetical protein
MLAAAIAACAASATARAQPAVPSQYVLPAGGNASLLTVQLPNNQAVTTTLTLAQILQDSTSLDVRAFGATMTGCTSTPTDDAAAVQAVTAQANYDYLTVGQVDTVFIPNGCLYSSVGFVFASGVPAHVVGAGPEASRFIWATSAKTGTNFSGDTVSWSNAFSGSLEVPTYTTISNPGTFTTGPMAEGFTIIGNTTLTGNGVVFYDNNDTFRVQQMNMFFIPGCGICGGLYKNNSSGMFREGFIEDNRLLMVGGGANNYPAIGIFSSCTGTACTTGSGSNAITVKNNRVYSYTVNGLLICPGNTNGAIHHILLNQNHWESSNGVASGSGVMIGSPSCTGIAPYSVDVIGDKSNTPAPGYDAFQVSGPSSYGTLANAPYDIHFLDVATNKGGNTLTTQGGIEIDYGGRGIVIDSTGEILVAGSQFICGSGVTGTISLSGGQDETNWTETLSCGANHVQRTARIGGTLTAGDAVSTSALGVLSDVGSPPSTYSGATVVGHAAKFNSTTGQLLDAGLPPAVYTGTPTAGHAVTISATGTLTDAGGAPALSSSGSNATMTVTPLTTVGNWAVSYGTRSYTYAVSGLSTCVNFTITFTPTALSTAAGPLEFSMPTTASAGEFGAVEVTNLLANGAGFSYPSGATYANFAPQPGKAYGYLVFYGTGLVPAPLNVSNLTAGTTYTVAGGSCFY